MVRRYSVLAWLAIVVAAWAMPVASADSVDPTLTLVLGDGISAGFSGFQLVQAAQKQAWPALVAKQMGTYIAIPTIRETGQTGIVNAYQPLPGLLPLVPQSGERALPFSFFSMNLSVPFLRVGESLRLRPQPQYDGIKLITSIEGDLKTTYVNAIIGGPLLALQPPVVLSQAEYAEMMNPTLVFIELGFEDVAQAAISNDPSRITTAGSFGNDYTQLLNRLLATDAAVVAMTVPDPADTAYFISIDDLARQYGMTSEGLEARFGLAPGDVITLGGMIEIADALRGRRGNVLSRGSVLSAPVAASVHSAVTAYNAAIRSAVQSTRARVFDLADFLHQMKTSGARVGSVSVTGAYLGGFYSEDGMYPSSTGQALLANAILQFLNSNLGGNFAPLDVEMPQ